MVISRASSLALLVALAGCTTTRTVVPPLPEPAPPVLPTVSAEDLECLTSSAYEALVVRDTMRKAYADRLRAIIQAHNRKAAEAADK